MYNPKEIEQKWQKYWEDNKTFKTENNSQKPKFYALDMFPYPSGAGLHVGHPEGYTANDIVSRYKKACGYNVLHPMGWDAFGLPAENYAIKTGTNPKTTTKNNIDTFRSQIKRLGFSYDWDREIDTTNPKYYKWTQWIFSRMFEHGLAYEQDLPINYCPKCMVGVANEEVLNNGTHERCGTSVEKKKLRQWVLGITKYADRLASDVDALDWPEGIKDMQKKWIGRSEGLEFEMKKEGDNSKSIKVYTTRIDTVFGMTYAVIAPDNESINDFITDEQKDTCHKYIETAKNKSDLDRTGTKEKTGVFTGSYVINPYNEEKVPLWIGDYVLGNYGTGAVMAVPAHDLRDFEFAKKYNLEIKQSIAENFEYDGKDAPRKGVETLNRKTIDVIIENEKGEILLQIENHSNGKHIHLIGGGIEDGDSELESVSKEIIEETGYTDFEIIGSVNLTYVYSLGYRANKNKNQQCLGRLFYVKLKSYNQIKSEVDEGKHDLMWVKKEDVSNLINWKGHKIFWNYFYNGERAFTHDGVLVNSKEFNLLSSKEAREKLTQYTQKNGFGTKKINYKLRDWLFSRQRYWGEPIPLIHIEHESIKKLPHISDISEATEENKAYILKRVPKKGENIDNCSCHGKIRELIIGKKVFSKIYDGLYSKIVIDHKLPLELPEVDNYEPSPDGNSPLARIDDFVYVELADNLSGKRETNTMPQWGGSCWYYLRFMDRENEDELVSKEVEKYWGGVDSYVGGAEHAVLHLLYARFWHKFLYDIGVVSTKEPFTRLRNQGLILAYAYENKNGGLIPSDEVEEKDGVFYHSETKEELKQVVAKMSKSLKNVVNPDDIVREYGADALRLYEMYMSDFKDSAPWDTKNIIGVVRFLEKVERSFKIEDGYMEINDIDNDSNLKDDEFSMKLLHKTIKKVGEDIENYKFNTAIAALMILIKHIPNLNGSETKWFIFRRTFLKLLHPFAPHLAEELWEQEKKLISKFGEFTKETEELKKSIFFAEWPKYDNKILVDDTIKMAVQVLGKVRGEIEINKDDEKEKVLEIAKNNSDVKRWIDGKEIIKEIYVPGRIINIVVK